MIRILGTIFAGLLGLAFGSFLNVCLSRWPRGESVVRPGSHCRNCDHSLAWWENVPLVSWLLLRGRCRKCGIAIGWRYPLVELAIGVLWANVAWHFFYSLLDVGMLQLEMYSAILVAAGDMVVFWMLIALAFLDAENLWLPDWITLPGIAVGLLLSNPAPVLRWLIASDISIYTVGFNYLLDLIQILAAAALILLIRWLYKLIRHREGIGLGDAKLMAMLAAWLGLPGALLAFGLGAVIGALTALALLPAARRNSEGWAATKLPLGTFLCIGGIISSLWGWQMIGAYLRWSGL
jgi:leader peptidase (prepilin peptidase) / N-methyltransferase